MWNMSWIAVLLAGTSGFALGGLWYGPLFGKAWQREIGVSDETIASGNMPLIFGTTFLLTLFMAFILGHTLATYGRPGVWPSVLIASGVGAGFVAPAIGVNYLFSRRSFKLFLIDAGYWVLLLTGMGVIFGLFA
jgi:hypothetical protein